MGICFYVEAYIAYSKTKISVSFLFFSLYINIIYIGLSLLQCLNEKWIMSNGCKCITPMGVCMWWGGGGGVCGVNAEYLFCHTRKLINCEVCFKFKGGIS